MAGTLGPVVDTGGRCRVTRRCLSIAGGTSQILLNVVAERALGLAGEEAR
jgi:alkylation response protein AidB-like acyl-CoA dehydrogenase